MLADRNEKDTGAGTIAGIIICVLGAFYCGCRMIDDARKKVPEPIRRVWFDRNERAHVR